MTWARERYLRMKIICAIPWNWLQLYEGIWRMHASVAYPRHFRAEECHFKLDKVVVVMFG